MSLCSRGQRAVNKRSHSQSSYCNRLGFTKTAATTTTTYKKSLRRRRLRWARLRPSIYDGRRPNRLPTDVRSASTSTVGIDESPAAAAAAARLSSQSQPRRPNVAVTNSLAYYISSTSQLTGQHGPRTEGKRGRPPQPQQRRRAAAIYLTTQISSVHRLPSAPQVPRRPLSNAARCLSLDQLARVS